jgi:hypothetical protein
MTDRFPLSYTQEMWLAWPNSFHSRFVLAEALRITGRIDVAALQGALDDLVRRHAILRTIVVLDDGAPYQLVHPPTPASLEVRDLAPDADREHVAVQLLAEAELSSVDVHRLPLLRARLTRFDDRDAVFTLVTHHTAADGWSLELLKRDLAACYAARVAGTAPELPQIRDFGEYAAWQREHAASPAGAAADDYWREHLDGAQIFALPTDRPVSTAGGEYRAHCHVVGADTMRRLAELGTTTRSSTFMVLMAVVNVLAHRISGTSDPAVCAMSAGRGQRAYRDTVGPFLDFLVLRTDLGDCTTFRDVLARTRRTCIGAASHEVPMNRIEQLVPELMSPLQNSRNCDFTFGFSRPLVGSAEIRIADGCEPIRQPDQESTGAPGGAIWTLGVVASGDALGKLQYNPDEFDDSTVAGWVTEFERLLGRAVEAPDVEWKTL